MPWEPRGAVLETTWISNRGRDPIKLLLRSPSRKTLRPRPKMPGPCTGLIPLQTPDGGRQLEISPNCCFNIWHLHSLRANRPRARPSPPPIPSELDEIEVPVARTWTLKVRRCLRQGLGSPGGGHACARESRRRCPLLPSLRAPLGGASRSWRRGTVPERLAERGAACEESKGGRGRGGGGGRGTPPGRVSIIHWSPSLPLPPPSGALPMRDSPSQPSRWCPATRD